MHPIDDARAGAPAPAGFIAALTLAYIGAFIAFVPLLTLLVPLKAAVLAPADKIGLLSLVTLGGAVTASIVNLAAGWASDHTRGRFGRRRPWILLGLIGIPLAYGAIGAAGSPAGLLFGIMGFQLAFNLMFAPLHAVFADNVPDRQRGRVAALIGLAAPIAAASGVFIASPLFPALGARLLVLGLLVTVCVLPLLLTLKDPPGSGRAIADSRGRAPARLSRDFGFVWTSRFCFQLSASVVSAFMLFYLADHARYGDRFPTSTVESGLAGLIAVSTTLTLLAGFLGGLLSDRMGRRKPFIVLAGTLMAAGLAVFAVWPEWPGPVVGYVLYGLGFGLYTTIDTALVAQTLPSRENTARDLGVMNLTNTLSSVLAPLLALIALGPGRSDWPSLMIASAGIAALGGLLVLGVRRVR